MGQGQSRSNNQEQNEKSLYEQIGVEQDASSDE